MLPIQRLKYGGFAVSDAQMAQNDKHLAVVLDTQVESVNLAPRGGSGGL